MPIFNNVKVTIVEKDSVRGFASCRVSDVLWLTGLRIINGKHGLFVSMPSQKKSNGDYHDIYFPASKDIRDELQATVLEEYHKAKGSAPAQAPDAPAPAPATGSDPSNF